MAFSLFGFMTKSLKRPLIGFYLMWVLLTLITLGKLVKTNLVDYLKFILFIISRLCGNKYYF